MTPDAGCGAASDTIVAIATAPGRAAIGVVRVSGEQAIDIASSVVRLSKGGDLRCARPRVATRADLLDPETSALLDVALVTVMPGPNSYTGQDVVEVSCHGNPVLLERVVRLLLSAGARLAAPGEFTRTAYLNGRLDLPQVEAVSLLIGASTERAAELAARELVGGGLSEAVWSARDQVVDLVAGLEVGLDFPEDDVGVSRSGAVARTEQLAHRLARMAAGARTARAVHDGLRLVLGGAPNVGKSSLLNALLGRDRAIVSPVPGTTRDVVEGALIVRGVPVMLMDVAGLGGPRNPIDAEAMQRSLRAIDEADLLIVVLDRSRPLSDEDRATLALPFAGSRLIVANKADLPAAWTEGIDCTCSALTGAGVGELRNMIERWVDARTTLDGDEGGAVASLRIIEQLEAARMALERARSALGAQVALEAILVDFRLCLDALDRILGGAADDIVLDRIFATFCVGK